MLAYAPMGVVCLMSAAVFYNLSTYRPDAIDVAVSKKKNVSTLPDWPAFNLYYFEKDRFQIGVQIIKEGSNQFQIYDIEKTVVDIVYYRNKIGIEETKEIKEDIYDYLINERGNTIHLKTVEVAAAIIVNENKIFATQRGYGEFKNGWEFPGGKIEEDESPQEALKREIIEELDTKIEVKELFETVEYDYPNFHLKMFCFICKIETGNLVLREHKDAAWLTEENIEDVPWLPADQGLIKKLKAEFFEKQSVKTKQ